MEKFRSILMILASLAVLTAGTVATDNTIAVEFGERLKEYSTRVETITCGFTQVRHVTMLTGDVSSTGRFYYKREGNICLEFDEPAGDMIVMRGNRFKIVNEGRRNVVSMNSNPMLKQMKNMLTACMTGDMKLLESGSDILYVDGGDTYILTISPSGNRGRAHVTSIVLTFDKSDMSLSRLRMNEASGDHTEYTFTDKAFNVPVDDSRFDI